MPSVPDLPAAGVRRDAHRCRSAGNTAVQQVGMDETTLLEELERVLKLLERGAQALLTFRQPGGAIVRDSGGVGGEVTIGTTSAHRTIAALADACRVLTAEGRGNGTVDALTQALAETWAGYFAPPLKDCAAVAAESGTAQADLAPLDVLRRSEANDLNDFTDAHLVLALSYAGTHWLPSADPAAAAAVAALLGQRLRERLLADAAMRGRVAESDPGHDFVTMWMARAADAPHASFGSGPPQSWPAGMAERVRDDLLKQLGWQSAGASGRFDPAELAFSLTLLQRLAPDEARPLSGQAIEVLKSTQTSDGAWPTSRLISPGGHRLLHVASYEVALAVAAWTELQATADESQDGIGAAYAMLARAFRLAESSLTQVTTASEGVEVVRRGWSNDRTRGQGAVESWATALVVTFLVRYHDLLRQSLERRILRRYDVQAFSQPAVTAVWPDLPRTYRRPALPAAVTAVRDALDKRISDPSPAGTLADEITEFIIGPILSSQAERPEGAVSFLLPGPPGSRKTSLVRAMAQTLGWPLLTVSPPTFLMEGLDGLERRAADVFADLRRLRRVVIFFDECEELFRRRDPNVTGTPPATRTVGAFITAGMLPRLQAVHDEARCLFAVATNAAVEQLDEAVVRPGRFDLQIPLNYPNSAAQLRYLRRKLKITGANHEFDSRMANALTAHMETAGIAGRTGLPWSVLDAVATYWLSSERAFDHQGDTELAQLLAASDQQAPRSLGQG